MRELIRGLLSENLFVTGLILTAAAMAIFYGTNYLLLYTNLGKKLAVLLLGAGITAWWTISSLLFVMYAPRGPRPVEIEGLNAFEVRIIPIAFFLVSLVLFIAFLVGLKQYEDAQEGRQL